MATLMACCKVGLFIILVAYSTNEVTARIQQRRTKRSFVEPQTPSRKVVREAVPELVPCTLIPVNVPRITECYKEGTFPVKDECRAFLTCTNANGTPEVTCCPEGLHFDHMLRQCMDAEVADCKHVCKMEGRIFPDPNKASPFLQCSPLGIPEEGKCPVGEIFVEEEQKCLETPLVNLPSEDVGPEVVESLRHVYDMIKELLQTIETPDAPNEREYEDSERSVEKRFLTSFEN